MTIKILAFLFGEPFLYTEHSGGSQDCSLYRGFIVYLISLLTKNQAVDLLECFEHSALVQLQSRPYQAQSGSLPRLCRKSSQHPQSYVEHIKT